MSLDSLSQSLSTLELEAKERALLLRNEQLDKRRDEIVERAEKLLNDQKLFLAEDVVANVSDDISSGDDIEEPLTTLPVAVEKGSSIMTPTETEEEEERPRRVIPQKVKSSSLRKKGGEQKESDILDDHNNDGIDGTVTVGDLEMESLLLGGSTIGKDAELRLQRARCKAMEKKLDDLVSMQGERERTVSEQQKVIKELEGRLKAVERERDGMNRKLSAEKKQNSDLLKRCKRLEAESYSVSSDLKEFKKEQKTKTESMRNAHIRLNRALEDAEKYRTLWIQHQDENRNRSEIHNEELVELKKENRVLIKQKNELLAAFRKQLKLIDVLKKQRLHLEAAKVLQFNETTFAKALDIGQEVK